ncbi:hypothetical protein CMO89_03940 [Candidatus Woesearchaeota archaeon]|nr:hypothetical protein [Candidatus Woesearchaeota archaeon]|tara:strand:- start:12517 stop:13371 length:855 start_codon:yes stop_codon:yes gene_type:complete
MLNKEDVLEIVKRKGPLIPVQVGSELKISIIMASALLAELADDNKVNISNLKVGGSPLYYVKEHRHKLQDYSNKLHEKEKKSYELLKEKKILRDSLSEPLTRVTLREIKDFAVPLNVNYKGVTETFWKWYLLPNAEAESLIRKELNVVKKEEKKEVKEEIKQEQKPHPVMKEKPVKKTAQKSDDFLKKVNEFFEKNKIKITNQNIIRKNNDIEFLVELPSSVGTLAYYCKARNKKRINEGDLSTVFIQAQSKKLPALFLTTGNITKKAGEMLRKEFQGMQVKNI